MAYTPHFLLQMIGTIGTANPEIWSCGIRMWAPEYSGFDEVEYMEGVAKDACAAWVTRATSKISNTVSLDSIKFNLIDADGHYADPGNSQEYIYPTPVQGGAGASLLPYQACIVLSWQTNDVTRGPGAKGRIYSPVPNVNVASTTGLYPTADALGAATSAATLLNTLDITISGSPFRPHIMSKIGGAHHQIDWVRVDNRVDIQRRRANALVAADSLVEVLY